MNALEVLIPTRGRRQQGKIVTLWLEDVAFAAITPNFVTEFSFRKHAEGHIKVPPADSRAVPGPIRVWVKRRSQLMLAWALGLLNGVC